jgi:hypothetical protein
MCAVVPALLARSWVRQLMGSRSCSPTCYHSKVLLLAHTCLTQQLTSSKPIALLPALLAHSWPPQLMGSSSCSPARCHSQTLLADAWTAEPGATAQEWHGQGTLTCPAGA